MNGPAAHEAESGWGGDPKSDADVEQGTEAGSSAGAVAGAEAASGAEAGSSAEAGTGGVSERSVDARLARLHLRGGLLALARAELEQMAGAGTLDIGALADLAEVRWRNGDLMGAAEAASAHLDAGGSEPTAMIICAEALDHDGHLLDARALAARALERVGGQVDRLFAGQPRSSAWSSAGSTPLPLAPGTMTWGGLTGGREVHDPVPSVLVPATAMVDEAPVAAIETAVLDAPTRDATTATRGAEPMAPPPDAHPTIAGTAPPTPSPVPALPGSIAERVETGRAAGKELGSIEEAIASQRLGGVPERLGLLLRADRSLAPLILSHADRALAVIRRNDPAVAALHLLRGDAYRALGRESDATAAFQQSLRAVAARTTDKEHQ